MKKIIRTVFAAIILPVALLLIHTQAASQTVVKIGEAEIAIQSPISIKKKETPANVNERDVSFGRSDRFGVTKSKHYPRSYEDFFVGIAMAVPLRNQEYLPMHYGSSHSIEVGFKYFYRPAARYAIGTLWQYSFYNYKLKDAAANETFVSNVPGEIRSESFRTDNLGTGIINRFYLFPMQNKPFMLDLGGYVDFSYSKRYHVKTIENGKDTKHKYRDGSKFNPIQAGLYGAITKGSYSLFAKYRLTNLFNPDAIPLELPRLSMGVQISLD
ncbi:MAG: hypothetical protein Q8S23_03620 [Bacteroidales bacterium]|jgi:hypothetical protein|nr:hypothetical protein [Bacteroidales bacterium]